MDGLTNLKWLDLSFNYIAKLEGLDKLTKLTDLSLYSNNIKKLEGLDNLHELNLLSIGKNKLEILEDSVKYLMGLQANLEVLRIDDNTFNMPNHSEKDYKKYAIAYLRDLKYLDYEFI